MLDILLSKIISLDIAAMATALWALAIARREMIKRSELENFDFWIRERGNVLLQDIQSLSKDYKANPSDETDTIILNTLSKFGRRLWIRYYYVIFEKNKIFWNELDAREHDTLMPHLEYFQDCCDHLDQLIKETRPYPDVIDVCMQVEFEFSDVVNHVRNRITQGKGLFKFWVFRKRYSK